MASWLKHGARPRTVLCLSEKPLGTKCLGFNSADLKWKKYTITIKHEITCPITVAIAAPAIPIPRYTTKIASRIIFITAPTILMVIVILGLPSALTRCPPPA